MEIWKDIEGYEGLYQVSNYGNVKSLKRKTNNQYGKEEKLLKTRKEKSGYLRVGLFKGNKQTFYCVHRLVATAFIPNEQGLAIINHKDENKLNNNVDNLEWCTSAYNNTYGSRIEKMSKSKEKKIVQLDLKGNVIKVWNSQKEVMNNLNISNHITDVCYGKRKKCGGYIWKFLVKEAI